MTKILIGADPELFVKNPNSGDFVSGHNMIKGTKKRPFPVEGGAVQVDGTALEFNIDPAHTADEFVKNINGVRAQLQAMVPGYNVVTEPVAFYDSTYFDTQVPAKAKELGCDPDYCGWTHDINPRPNPGQSPFRTASGHIHIGWTDGVDPHDEEHFAKCAAMARQMDYYLGVWSLLWDDDPTRRQLYGKAGAFRPKSYGMEYRTLSNRWLSSQLLIRWVYESAYKGAEQFLAGNEITTTFGDMAQTIIDENDVNWGRYLDLSYYNIPRLPVGAIERKVA